MTTFTSNAFDITIATTPAFAQGLALYEGRILEGGTYGPASGSESISDVAQSGWQNPYAVFTQWSGGAPDQANKMMYYYGSGHNGGNSNALYKYDYAAVGGKPTGPSLVDASNPAIGPDIGGGATNNEYYSDGRPGAHQTYSIPWFDSVSGRFYSGGGPTVNQGNWSTKIDHLTVANGNVAGANNWNTDVISIPSGLGKAWATCWHQPSRKCLFAEQLGSGGAWIYNASSNTFSARDGSLPPYNLYISMTASTSSGHVLMTGSLRRVLNMDWGNDSVVTSPSYTATGTGAAVADDNFNSVTYDEDHDIFWLMSGNESDFGNIYSVSGSDVDAVAAGTSSSITFNQHPISGASPVPFSTEAPYQGGYHQGLMYLPGWNVCVAHHAYSRGPTVIRVA